MKEKSKSRKDLYQMITEKIITKLEQGVVPWRKPWVNANAVNWKTQKPYRGINTLLLDAGEYVTFNQIKEAGGKVIPKSKSHMVVFWKWIAKENEDGEVEKIPFLRYYNVFEINTQVEGLKSKREEITFNHNPIEQAEEIYKNYLGAPSFTFNAGKAWYSPSLDRINCPPLKDFYRAEEYYSVLYHEMIHSTGHETRLSREGVTEKVAFGDSIYSKEELVAELGASMLCAVAKIDNNTIENSASYINSWLRALKNDNRLIVQSAQQAQKAVDYILNIKFSD